MNILDILGILIIFGIVLYIGWRATKKTATSEEFLMANRGLNKWQVGLSMAASDFGGNGVVGGVAYAYAVGIAGGWYNWGAVVPLLILSFLIAKQLRGLNIVSVPELLGRRYCSGARLISTVSQLLASAATLGMQFTVSAATVSAITGVDYKIALIVSVVIVVAYTMGGGLTAVVNTDVFQFFVVVASILIAIPVCMYLGGGWDTIHAKLPDGFLDLGAEGFLVPLSLGVLYMFDYATNQHILQRVFSAKDASTAKFAFAFTGITYIFHGLAVAFLGVLAFVLLPGLSDTSLAYPLLIKEALPAGLRGLSLGGIFAATMACSDSKILAASTLFVNDIYKPYITKGNEVSDQKVLSISRWMTLIISVLGIGIALVSESLLQMVYLCGLFYGTAVFIPMIAALYWRRATAPAAMTAIIVSILLGLYWEFFVSGVVDSVWGSIPSNLAAVVVSGFLFVVISLVTKRPSREQLSVLEDQIH